MQAQQDDVITPQQAGTLYGLFLERARRSPDKIAYRHFQQNAWRDFTWREMLVEVARWQAALAGLGLQRGDRVAIMLRNCPCWVMFDQAAMSLGLVVVPLYTVDRPGNIAYIVNDADIKVLLFENDEQWQALRTVRDRLGGVKRFVSIDIVRNGIEPHLKSIAEFLPPAAQLQAGNPLGETTSHSTRLQTTAAKSLVISRKREKGQTRKAILNPRARGQTIRCAELALTNWPASSTPPAPPASPKARC